MRTVMIGFKTSKVLAALIFAVALAPTRRATAATKTLTLPAGWYDGTKVSEATGDEDGLRLKLEYAAGKPLITFWWCEGECFPRTTHDLSITGDTITFVADDELFSPEGKRVEIHLRRFSGTFRDGRLLLGSVGFWKPQQLKWFPFLTREQEIERARKLLREQHTR
jgi:hypothetical protein